MLGNVQLVFLSRDGGLYQHATVAEWPQACQLAGGRIYLYEWYHLPTGKTDVAGIYTESYNVFVRLLSEWNSQQPKYWVYAEFMFPVPQKKESVAMPKVTVKMEKVKKMVETEVTVKTYQLTLSEAEARTLRMVSAAIGGCPKTTPRKHTHAIDLALDEAGVPWISSSGYVDEMASCLIYKGMPPGIES